MKRKWQFSFLSVFSDFFWQEEPMSKLNAILPSMMPDFVRFLLIVAAMAGAIYGSALALATFPPEPSDVTSSLPHEKLRQD